MVRHINCVLELRRSQAAQAARVINQLEEEANSSENNMGIVICNLQAASGWRAVRLARAGAQSTLELDGKIIWWLCGLTPCRFLGHALRCIVPHAVQVHYRACPVSLLLPWTPEVGQSTFINSLKVLLLHICFAKQQWR